MKPKIETETTQVSVESQDLQRELADTQRFLEWNINFMNLRSIFIKKVDDTLNSKDSNDKKLDQITEAFKNYKERKTTLQE